MTTFIDAMTQLRRSDDDMMRENVTLFIHDFLRINNLMSLSSARTCLWTARTAIIIQDRKLEGESRVLSSHELYRLGDTMLAQWTIVQFASVQEY